MDFSHLLAVLIELSDSTCERRFTLRDGLACLLMKFGTCWTVSDVTNNSMSVTYREVGPFLLRPDQASPIRRNYQWLASGC